MLCIFFAQNYLVNWYMPVNAKRIIQDADATVSLWMIKLITLVLEDSCLRENGKAVGEALWDKELNADG